MRTNDLTGGDASVPDAAGPDAVDPDAAGPDAADPDTARIEVVGCSGGLGASSLACALALRAGRDGPVVLVDGDPTGGGLDTTAGVEHEAGLRWGDLAGHDGAADGAALRAALPVGPVPVLAADGFAPPPGTAAAVLAGLAQEGTLVVDRPGWTCRSGGLLADPGAVWTVFLVGLSPRGLCDAEATVATWTGERGGVVTRGRRRYDLVGEAVAEHLGLPLLAHLPDDPACRAQDEHGAFPGSRPGALARTADRVWQQGQADLWSGRAGVRRRGRAGRRGAGPVVAR